MDGREESGDAHTASVLEGVAQVIRTTFKTPNVIVTRETTADQVPGWDSLSHAVLLMHVERAFGIYLEPADVVCLLNVGELVDMVAAKVAG